MDLNEWKRLSRTEKERVWDTLSSTEKEMVRRYRSSKGRGNRSSAGARRNELFSRSVVAFAFRATASAAALLAAMMMFVDIPLLNERVLLLLLVTCGAAGFASILDHLGAILEELREANARRTLRESRESPGQSAKKASTADADSVS